MILHPLVHFAEKRRMHGTSDPFRERNWKRSSVYHAQAYAYQALGSGGPWKIDGLIPTTDVENRLSPIWKVVEDMGATSTTEVDLESVSPPESASPVESSTSLVEKVEMKGARDQGR